MSLRFKIVVAIAGLILILGLAGTLHARLTLSGFSQDELNRRALALSQHLEGHAVELLAVNDVYGLHTQLNEFLLSNDDVRYIAVLDANGDVRASTFLEGLPLGLRDANSVPPDQEYAIASISTNEGNVLDTAYPVAGGTRGTVRLGLSQDRLDNQVGSLTFNLLALTGGVLLASLLVGYLLAKFLTSPLSRLAEAAQAVGRGELSQRVDVPDDREVGQVAVAFNAMAEKLQEKEAERRRLLAKVMAAHEDERKRIARELHDEAGQTLTSLLLGLKHIEDGSVGSSNRAKVAELRSLTSRTLDLVRDMALELRPSTLDHLGLVAALERYVAEYGRKHGLEADFDAGGLDGARLSPQTETALYRIAQEALTNVIRHARARGVSVLLERRDSRAILVVEDDGAGFDAEAARYSGSPASDLGILGMEERAVLVGGTLTIESRPGHGTAVFVEVPLEVKEDGAN
ncbi:MAG: HAMP domain-containing protein [Dehalococcoidia bacterium]|nr:MAG: HAMP domain-containing protein [Dehalococcoidia bacterium]